ncbi:hypothetical protein [Enterocloster citroniae]|uniref:hypothetical protein n=1 Tax=Enterocloster citroniae TaxID=358743 RepID=UPI0032BF7509
MMTYPVDVEAYANRKVADLKNPDEGDRELFKAIAIKINRAYYAGLEDGKEEATICRN